MNIQLVYTFYIENLTIEPHLISVYPSTTPPPLSHPTSYQTGRPVFTSALHRPLTLLQGMGHQNEHGGQCFEEPQQKEICEYFATIFFLSSLE